MAGPAGRSDKLKDWPADKADAYMAEQLDGWLKDWAVSTVRAGKRQRGEAESLTLPDGSSRDVPDANAADLMAEVEFADVWAKYPTVAAIIRDGYTEQELAEREGVSQPAIHYRYKRELSRIKSELDLAA
jgi:hypothetical protein